MLTAPANSPGIEMAIFLAAAIAGSILAQKMKQTALVGQILIGIVIGQGVLGLVSYNEFVKSIAEFGIIILLFLIGLDSKFKEVYNAKNIVIASIACILPWIMGLFISKFFGYNSIQSFFIATSVASTSSAVVGSFLTKFNLIKQETGKIVIGASIVDDIIGLIALSVTVKMSEGAVTIQMIGFKIFVALAFLFIFFFIGVKISKQLSKLEFWGKTNGHPQIGFMFTLMLAFVYSAAAELVGLSSIVGAFVAGLSLAHVENKSFVIGAQYFEQIFGSLFFVSLGILINIIDALKNLNFIIALTVLVLIGKYIGGIIGSRLCGYSKETASLLGTTMMPIGEIAAITSIIALNKGIFDNSLYSSIIFVGIFTTIFSLVVLNKKLGFKSDIKKPLDIDIKHKKTTYSI
ncbi:MAG: cation:proton antiporter [archaeon]